MFARVVAAARAPISMGAGIEPFRIGVEEPEPAGRGERW
jgi:hypothetical protein